MQTDHHYIPSGLLKNLFMGRDMSLNYSSFDSMLCISTDSSFQTPDCHLEWPVSKEFYFDFFNQVELCSAGSPYQLPIVQSIVFT